MEKEQENYANKLASVYPAVRCETVDATGNVRLTPGTSPDADGEGFVALGQAHIVSVDGICVRHEVSV